MSVVEREFERGLVAVLDLGNRSAVCTSHSAVPYEFHDEDCNGKAESILVGTDDFDPINEIVFEKDISVGQVKPYTLAQVQSELAKRGSFRLDLNWERALGVRVFIGGRYEDEVWFQDTGTRGISDPAVDEIVGSWATIRSLCLREMADRRIATEHRVFSQLANSASAAVLLLTEKGSMVWANERANALVAEGRTFRLNGGRLDLADETGQVGLKAELASLFDRSDKTGLRFVMVRQTPVGKLVPLFLMRAPASMAPDGRPANLALAVAPQPPSTEQIARIARAYDLTPAEARVVELMCKGESHRSVAEGAGLTVSSSRTYAKRAFAKMNVHSLAQLAYVLTWQALGAWEPQIPPEGNARRAPDFPFRETILEMSGDAG